MSEQLSMLSLPSANPSFAHCTVPAKFVISQRSSASDPSNTVRLCGFVRNCCLAANALSDTNVDIIHIRLII